MPLSFPGQGLKDRDVILGVQLGGQARAFPGNKSSQPDSGRRQDRRCSLVIVTAPDGVSVRMFRSQWNGSDIELYRDTQTTTNRPTSTKPMVKAPLVKKRRPKNRR